MRKLISSINITVDGYCDHTAVIADEALHENANALFKSIDLALFGRKTYQLMESSWPPILANPTGSKSVDEFAALIDDIPKLVFSTTLLEVSWKNSRLATGSLEEEVKKLKQESGKDILVGSPGLIIELMNLGLIDEYQFCVQPIILGTGLPLFKNIYQRVDLKLVKIKTLNSGVVVLNYQPAH